MNSVVALDTTTSFDMTSLIQYGVLGVVLILVLFGYLWAKPSVDRILADKTKAEEQRDALLDIYQTKVIPVLNEVKDQVVPGMARVFEQQARASEQQEALSRQQSDLARQIERVLEEVKRLAR